MHQSLESLKSKKLTILREKEIRFRIFLRSIEGEKKIIHDVYGELISNYFHIVGVILMELVKRFFYKIITVNKNSLENK